MRITVVALLVALTRSSLASSVNDRHIVALPCLIPGASDAGFILGFKATMADTNPAGAKFKIAFGLSGLDSAAVSVVSDTLVCTRVTHVVNSGFAVASPAAHLIVLQAGPRYVSFGAGHPAAMFVLDTTFRIQVLGQ